MVLFIAAICICTVRCLISKFPTYDMAFSVAIEMEGPYLPMQIDLLLVQPHFPAARKGIPWPLMPPRRRREAFRPRCRGSDMRLPCAPESLILFRPLLLPYKQPSCSPNQQHSIHHQARDTLQGDEGD